MFSLILCLQFYSSYLSTWWHVKIEKTWPLLIKICITNIVDNMRISLARCVTFVCSFIFSIQIRTVYYTYHKRILISWQDLENVNELTNFPKLSTWMVGDEKRCRWLRHMRGRNSWKSAISTSPFYGSSGVRSALSWCHCMMRTLAIENNTRVTSSVQFQTENMSVYSTTTLMRKILNIRWWVT